MSNRAQSSVIGVVLLTGVVIISITTIGVFWLGSISDQADASGPLVDVDVEVTDTNVTVRHRTGETVDLADVRVIVRNGSSTEEFRLDAGTVRGGDGDGTFEPSEDVVHSHGLGSGTFEVVIVHDPSNTVIRREHENVGLGSSDGISASFSYSPGSPETGEMMTVDTPVDPFAP